MSLVVIVLSLAVLCRTTGVALPPGVRAKLDALLPLPAPPGRAVAASPAIPAVPPQKAVTPAAPGAPKADLMLTIDVEPHDANLVVHPTDEGFQVKVAASGYQPATRTVGKGVAERIALKLERAPKKAAKKKKRHGPKRRSAKANSSSDPEVFLTGSDL